jgi:hypothetical protein
LKKLRNREQTKKQIDSMAGEINDLETNLQAIESQIRATSPRYAALTQPKPLSASEIQQEVLDQNTVLLEYALGDLPKSNSSGRLKKPTPNFTRQLRRSVGCCLAPFPLNWRESGMGRG